MTAHPDDIAIALRLAREHPQASWPCPECAASVKAENLAKHLAKTHAVTGEPKAGSDDERRSWRGVDARSRTELTVLLVLAALAFAAVTALGYRPDQLPGLVTGAASLLLFALLTVALFEKLPATLSLQGDVFELRYGLGLRQRTLRLPARVHVGGLVERRAVGRTYGYGAETPENVDTEDRAAGTYIRLESDAGTLTIGCRKGTGLRKHWQGWQGGSRQRRWDITVPREALVALEYQLARRSLLTPREQ